MDVVAFCRCSLYAVGMILDSLFLFAIFEILLDGSGGGPKFRGRVDVVAEAESFSIMW